MHKIPKVCNGPAIAERRLPPELVVVGSNRVQEKLDFSAYWYEKLRPELPTRHPCYEPPHNILINHPHIPCVFRPTFPAALARSARASRRLNLASWMTSRIPLALCATSQNHSQMSVSTYLHQHHWKSCPTTEYMYDLHGCPK